MFEARTRIGSDPMHIWNTLVQTDQWSRWDSSIDRVEGALTPSGRITLHVKGQKRPFKLKVATWEPGRQLVLRGGMPLGLFTGRRTYGLGDANGDGVAFTMVERFTGPLAPLIRRSIPDLQPSFDAFVAGLRSAAEA